MENWKQVVGYEGLYEVSDIGRVKRVGKWSDRNRVSNRVIVTSIKKGYAVAAVCKEGRVKHAYIHVFVAEAFLGPKPLGLEVNHKNGIKHDNRPENLEYVTRSENQLHSHRILGNKPSHGDSHYRTKVTEFDASQFLGLRAEGLSYTQIGNIYGVGCGCVSRKIRGKTRKESIYSNSTPLIQCNPKK